MRENGLIYADAPGKALTWMDAVVNGIPVTARRGYAVEVNALWYNAICFSLEMATKENDKKFIKEYEKLPGLIKKSFIEIFWDEKLWRYVFLALAVVFGAAVLLAHVHYSIDVFAILKSRYNTLTKFSQLM